MIRPTEIFSLRVAMLTALGCALIPSLWLLHFGQLFPLSEIREWLGWGHQPKYWDEAWRNVLFRNTLFSRDVSMMTSYIVGNACGTNIVCVNTLAVLPLCAAAGAMAWLLRRLGATAVMCAMAVIGWVVSVPFLDTMAWQATINDRVAAFFLYAGLAVFASAALRERRDTYAAALGYALVLFVCVIGALNSKESAWPLLPAMLLGLLLLNINRERRRALVLQLSPSLIYAGWFAFRYVAVSTETANQGWRAHTTSGSALSNATEYIKMLAYWPTLLVIAGVIIFCVHRFILRDARCSPSTSPRDRTVLWLLLCALMLAVIALRTRYAAAYYMVLPLGLMWCAVALWSSKFQWRGERRHHVAVVVCIALLLGCQLTAFYRHEAQQAWLRSEKSVAFIDAMRQNEAKLRANPKAPVCFILQQTVGENWMFVNSLQLRDITRWIFGESSVIHSEPTVLASGFSPRAARVFTADEATPALTADCISIRLDSGLAAVR
jgi:hypothetical protein